jgi:hypothetical protein
MCGLRVVIIIGHQEERREFYIKRNLMFCLSLLLLLLLNFIGFPPLSGEAGGVAGGGRETAEHVVGMFSPGVVVK